MSERALDFGNDPERAYHYARDVVKDRVPELEEVIGGNPFWAYLYARDIIKGGDPELVGIIGGDSAWTKLYVMDVITHMESTLPPQIHMGIVDQKS